MNLSNRSATDLVADRPYFDAHSVVQTWARLSDFRSFVQIDHPQQDISSNRFFGFGERSVDYRDPLFSGNDFAVVGQWLAEFGLAFVGQSIKPGAPSAHDLLDFFC